EDGIRDFHVTGVQTCALPICTTVGWKGLINDPHLDGSHDVHHGLRLAREVLLGVLDAGVPAACEFLEPTSPQYIADAVSWGAIRSEERRVGKGGRRRRAAGAE